MNWYDVVPPQVAKRQYRWEQARMFTRLLETGFASREEICRAFKITPAGLESRISNISKTAPVQLYWDRYYVHRYNQDRPDPYFNDWTEWNRYDVSDDTQQSYSRYAVNRLLGDKTYDPVTGRWIE